MLNQVNFVKSKILTMAFLFLSYELNKFSKLVSKGIALDLTVVNRLFKWSVAQPAMDSWQEWGWQEKISETQLSLDSIYYISCNLCFFEVLQKSPA